MIQLEKQADGFVEGVFRTIKDKTRLFDRPFETIFAILTPVLVWNKSVVLGALLFIAENLGYGPGRIGRLIDRALGIGEHGRPDLSSASLKGAATTTVDMLLRKLGMRTESMAKELSQIKETIEIHDLVALAACVKQNPIEKVAYSPGRTRYLRRFLGKTVRGGRLGLINGLWAILKLFAKGIIGLGIAGGVVSKTKELMHPETGAGVGGPSGLSGLFPPGGEAKPLLMQGSTDLYLNVKNDIEDTLIYYLDSAYKVRSQNNSKYITFSDMFRKLNGYALKGSGEMQDVIKTVDGLNWGELAQINEKRTFVGPKLEGIAKKLIPVMKIESGRVKDKDLLEALRGVYK